MVSAFLRGYFDADAYAGPEGIRLSSASEDLIRTVQIVLLNYGILSRQRKHLYGVTQLEIAGASASRFLDDIGFSLCRKQQGLRDYVQNHHWFKPEDLNDEIVSIERGCADVYDITVDEKHAYVANGFVNHNSFWHSRIMREMDCPTKITSNSLSFTRASSRRIAISSIPITSDTKFSRISKTLGQSDERGAGEVRT